MGDLESECVYFLDISRYRSLVVYKVLINNPVRTLDTTTKIRLTIKEYKDILRLGEQDIIDDIVFTHVDSNIEFDYTIVLDGGRR